MYSGIKGQIKPRKRVGQLDERDNHVLLRSRSHVLDVKINNPVNADSWIRRNQYFEFVKSGTKADVHTNIA
jgi:hypothetical protein